MSNHRKVIIIGTGPAGLTAALYTARGSLKPLVIEGKEPGGQLTLTTEVENFPGFPNGIMGPELMSNMRQQALKFGADYLTTNVTSVDLSKKPFNVVCENDDKFTADAIIIATGASAKFLGLPNEKELVGKGVSTCATCDGFFYRNKVIHVVGGGDTALEEANVLTKFASIVHVVHRKSSLRASKPMQERSFNNPKIKFIWNSEVVKLNHDSSGLNGIEVRNVETGEVTTRATDGLFYGIGHNPNTSFLNKQLTLDEHGFVLTKNGTPETNIPGVFACGDVMDNYYRQAITAAGSGCAAAIRTEKYLEANGLTH